MLQLRPWRGGVGGGWKRDPPTNEAGSAQPGRNAGGRPPVPCTAPHCWQWQALMGAGPVARAELASKPAGWVGSWGCPAWLPGRSSYSPPGTRHCTDTLGTRRAQALPQPFVLAADSSPPDRIATRSGSPRALPLPSELSLWGSQEQGCDSTSVHWTLWGGSTAPQTQCCSPPRNGTMVPEVCVGGRTEGLRAKSVPAGTDGAWSSSPGPSSLHSYREPIL